MKLRPSEMPDGSYHFNDGAVLTIDGDTVAHTRGALIHVISRREWLHHVRDGYLHYDAYMGPKDSIGHTGELSDG